MARKLKALSSTEKKSVLLSVIALFEIIALVMVSSFGWLEGTTSPEANVNVFQVGADSGLLFYQNGHSVKEITVNKADLVDCSSVDGRNLYFTTTGTSVVKNSPKFLVFRSGTDEDKNKYITVDFQVANAHQVGNSMVDVSLDPTSYIKYKGTYLPAARVSFNMNDGSEPVCYSGTINGDSINNAVASINTDGSPNYTSATYKALDCEETIFSVLPGETKNITMTIWLDGFGVGCNDAGILPAEDIDINIQFGTAMKDVTSIRIVDYSVSEWLDDPHNDNTTTIFLVDESTNNSYLMNRTTYEGRNAWESILPKSAAKNSFRFERRNGSTNEVLNYWSAGSIAGDMNTYYAIGQGRSVDLADYGYWVNSDCSKMLHIYYTDTNDVLSIADSDSTKGHAPFLSVYSTQYGTFGNSNHLVPWGGLEMAYSGLNSYNQPTYHMIIPADPAATIIFNNSCRCSSHGSITKKETNKLRLTDYITDSDPQVKALIFYPVDGVISSVTKSTD